MNIDKSLVCQKCNGVYFKIRREATYLYTYTIDTPSTENSNENTEALPFLFDNREQVNSREYLECEQCGAKYPCALDELGGKIHFTILQKAIRSDYEPNPNFLG